ncbi:PHD finger protein 21A [Aphis craccivora]|uniref:PHD finger protein 21A n=1 Tax=Aphis craccivora TaxID=307492 RepID=A0A6G0YHI2_APHCR|nr:PHD finger protein 21A [Aphis craccivora]
MKEIMRLIAEPNSVNNKKRQENPSIPHPLKNIDPTACNLCSDSTGFICSEKYHKSSDKPIQYFNPNFSRNKYDGKKIDNFNTTVRHKMKNIFDFEHPFVKFESFLEEVPIQRKFNVKPPARKQLDKLKMIRKNERCVVCKKGVLDGRLVQCHHCTRLYHLNCLDPPIRDWDHNMRWVCPAHDHFLELAYPDVFPPGQKLLTTNSITTKRSRCEEPSKSVDEKFPAPDHVSKIHKEPEHRIPTTSKENSSLNILCDIASIELETINSIERMNKTSSITNYVCDKFLQKSKSLQPIKCSATLTCLSIPITISVQREVITIGKSIQNRVCLKSCKNCENISDFHATISFDEVHVTKTGNFILKNLSQFGVIVDNASYFGNHKQPSNNHELKKVNSELQRHINKQRKTIKKDKFIQVTTNSDDEKPVVKYAGKKRPFNYKPITKYYISKYKNMKHNYKKAQCKCSKRFVQKDGYSGLAVLRNESIIFIGCMKFKFSYDEGTIKTLKVCSEESLSKVDTIVKKKSFNESHLKCFSEQENGSNVLVDTINHLNSFSINENSSLEDTDTNSINKLNNIDKLNLDNSAHNEIVNTMVEGISEYIVHDHNIQSSEMNLFETSDSEYIQDWNIMNALSTNENSCSASDLIQEVEVNESSEYSEVVEEEIVYEMNYVPLHIDDAQEWVIEEIVVENKEPEHSDDLQSSLIVGSPVPACDDEDLKTEHIYCARSLTYDDEVIVISDDDEDVNYITDSDNDGED